MHILKENTNLSPSYRQVIVPTSSMTNSHKTVNSQLCTVTGKRPDKGRTKQHFIKNLNISIRELTQR